GFGCARIAGGRVQCWSGNEANRPADVPALAGAVQVAVGELSGCAVMGDATVRCWGANESGQLGREASDDSELREIPGLQGVAQVVLGNWHGCARMRDGTVRCWGSEGTGAYPARCLRMTHNQSHGPHGGG